MSKDLLAWLAVIAIGSSVIMLFLGTLLGNVILFIGVVIGWLLRGLWRSVRERRVSDTMFRTVKQGKTTIGKLGSILKRGRDMSIDAEIKKSLKKGESYNEFLDKKVNEQIKP